MKGTKSATPPAPSNLTLSLGDFLAHVRRLAVLVAAHAKRLSAATEGRIDAKTSKNLLQLVDQLTQIDSDRAPVGPRSSRAVVAEATRLLSELKSASAYAATTNTKVRGQLRNVFPGQPKRSAASILSRLRHYVDFALDHPKAIGGLLPRTTIPDAQRVMAEYKANAAAVKETRIAASLLSAKRNTIIGELQRISSDVRALAAVLFRREPEVARQFALPRRRTKKRATPAAPPAEGAER